MGSAEPHDERQEVETHIAPPPATGATEPATSPVAPPAATGFQSSAQTLRSDEVLRTRRYLTIMAVMFVVVALSLPLFGGDPARRHFFTAMLWATFGSYVAFVAYIRDASRYSAEKALLPVLVGTVGGFSASLYYGVYSPSCMVFTLGIYFFSLCSSAVASFTVYAASALLQAAGMLLVTFGWMEDRGLVRVEGVPRMEQLGIFLLVQVVYAMTFLFGRRSRDATLSAMSAFETALRQVGQREALLQEANFELDRVREEGNRGRWSGERLGPWLLSRLIGQGGMGDVYEAFHETRELRAAVKLLLPESARDPDRRRRFLREAELIGRLESPQVPKLYEVSGEGAAPFMAMELLKGEDLGRYLRRMRQLPPAEVLELVDQVSGLLQRARALEIVHRDLKPGNLFRTWSGERVIWKVLDFGISKVGLDSGTLTRANVMGSPGYLAPEQAQVAAVDHRADLFSLGVITYRALTGQPAFSADNYTRMLFQIVYVQPARPSSLAELHPDVDFALALALAKAPEDRFESATDFCAALHAAVAGTLDAGVRARAEALLRRAPWGARLAAG